MADIRDQIRAISGYGSWDYGTALPTSVIAQAIANTNDTTLVVSGLVKQTPEAVESVEKVTIDKPLLSVVGDGSIAARVKVKALKEWSVDVVPNGTSPMSIWTDPDMSVACDFHDFTTNALYGCGFTSNGSWDNGHDGNYRPTTAPMTVRNAHVGELAGIFVGSTFETLTIDALCYTGRHNTFDGIECAGHLASAFSCFPLIGDYALSPVGNRYNNVRLNNVIEEGIGIDVNTRRSAAAFVVTGVGYGGVITGTPLNNFTRTLGGQSGIYSIPLTTSAGYSPFHALAVGKTATVIFGERAGWYFEVVAAGNGSMQLAPYNRNVFDPMQIQVGDVIGVDRRFVDGTIENCHVTASNSDYANGGCSMLSVYGNGIHGLHVVGNEFTVTSNGQQSRVVSAIRDTVELAGKFTGANLFECNHAMNSYQVYEENVVDGADQSFYCDVQVIMEEEVDRAYVSPPSSMPNHYDGAVFVYSGYAYMGWSDRFPRSRHYTIRNNDFGAELASAYLRTNGLVGGRVLADSSQLKNVFIGQVEDVTYEGNNVPASFSRSPYLAKSRRFFETYCSYDYGSLVTGGDGIAFFDEWGTEATDILDSSWFIARYDLAIAFAEGAATAAGNLGSPSSTAGYVAASFPVSGYVGVGAGSSGAALSNILTDASFDLASVFVLSNDWSYPQLSVVGWNQNESVSSGEWESIEPDGGLWTVE